MAQPHPANWQIAIDLPLGVVDQQLRKIEEQLRILNMKALEFAADAENTVVRRQIDARLEHINELLGSIARLVSDIGADMQTRERKPHADRDD